MYGLCTDSEAKTLLHPSTWDLLVEGEIRFSAGEATMNLRHRNFILSVMESES